MHRTAIGVIGSAFVLFCSILHAQVPQLINYQGRIVVGTTNFDGTGQFKFALVNTNGSKTYWSNDSTSSAGGEPTAAVSLPVSKGLYAVLLGDTSLANMTAIPASVFTNSNVRLRVWFNDGINGSQLLAPDQSIAAVGYAMMAVNVSDGAITSAKIANRAVGNSQLASGAAAANLNASGQSGVASGGVILSSTDNNATLIATGYVKIGTVQTGDLWQQRTNGVPPSARYRHTAVWTGSEMIVWGGYNNSSYLNDGGRYNPAANSWSATASSGAPIARAYHTAVWTGSEMIVWGGYNGSSLFNDGAHYNPAADTWSATASSGAPSARFEHTAVWTGSEMIVWGGNIGGTLSNDGARYNPAVDSWSATASGGAPAARLQHTAVWTGSEMIVWGGFGVSNDGARYNPAADSWSATVSSGAPSARSGHTAVWTGSEMIVWGGGSMEGARYNPAARDSFSSWTATPSSPSSGVPYTRAYHTAVWTGVEMIVWGGNLGATIYNDTYSYTPGKTMFLYQKP